MAELADARGSGPRTRKGVGVRVPSMAPKELGTALAVPFTFCPPILRDTRFCGILKAKWGYPIANPDAPPAAFWRAMLMARARDIICITIDFGASNLRFVPLSLKQLKVSYSSGILA